MNWRNALLAVLVIAVVALAIYLAMRPSQSAAELAASSSAGSTRAGDAIASIGGTATGFAASIANAAG